jgi:hypothetical protein
MCTTPFTMDSMSDSIDLVSSKETVKASHAVAGTLTGCQAHATTAAATAAVAAATEEEEVEEAKGDENLMAHSSCPMMAGDVALGGGNMSIDGSSVKREGCYRLQQRRQSLTGDPDPTPVDRSRSATRTRVVAFTDRWLRQTVDESVVQTLDRRRRHSDVIWRATVVFGRRLSDSQLEEIGSDGETTMGNVNRRPDGRAKSPVGETVDN